MAFVVLQRGCELSIRVNRLVTSSHPDPDVKQVLPKLAFNLLRSIIISSHLVVGGPAPVYQDRRGTAETVSVGASDKKRVNVMSKSLYLAPTGSGCCSRL